MLVVKPQYFFGTDRNVSIALNTGNYQAPKAGIEGLSDLSSPYCFFFDQTEQNLGQFRPILFTQSSSTAFLAS